jgi:hypothetical protein
MKYILHQPWGGLGDNLQFSTLPEMLTKRGHEFFLHSMNSYRNPEIYDLVWKNNPYVKGITDETPNAGSVMISNLSNYSSDLNFIRRWELAHGIDEPRDHYYPTLYYQPKKIEELADKTIVSISAITLPHEYYIEAGILKELEKLSHNEDVISLNFDKFNFSYFPYGEKTINVENIYHHCDIIFSCKKYVTLFTGSAMLASIIKNTSFSPNVHVFITPRSVNEMGSSNFFMFENTNYHLL